jgi:hypothetical protein
MGWHAKNGATVHILSGYVYGVLNQHARGVRSHGCEKAKLIREGGV